MAEDRLNGLFLGLISGTSADGIDAALVELGHHAPVAVASITCPYPSDLRDRILDVSQRDVALSLDAYGELDHRIADAFADAALRVLDEAAIEPNQLRAIGSHGQTLRHRPGGNSPFTLQCGDPSVLAERLGTTVVADFRRRDVAAGGQGAPLMPAFHAAILGGDDDDRAVLNLGGIGNLTLLPRSGDVSGFDTGPANGLMDAWCLQHTGRPFDRSGEWAAAGKINDALLQRLLGEPWLALPPPKSTGRDLFHLGWLASHLEGIQLEPMDVQATLLALSAISIADLLRKTLPECRRLIVCGGGVHNLTLMKSLDEALPNVVVESSARHGIDPDFVEASGFAWLARETLAGRPGNLPRVTGARGPRVLGAIYPV